MNRRSIELHGIAVRSRLPVRPWVMVLCSAALLTTNVEGMSRGEAPSGGEAARCVSNLKKIYELIKMNEHHSGGVVPSDLETIYLMSRKPEIFVCPSDKHPDKDKATQLLTSYEFVKRASDKRSPAAPARSMAIVFERRPNHDGRRHVLFDDGSIVLLTDVDFEALQRNGFIRK